MVKATHMLILFLLSFTSMLGAVCFWQDTTIRGTSMIVPHQCPAIQEALNNAFDAGTNFEENSTHSAHAVGFEADFAASSALEWNRTYGGTGSDYALVLVRTTDGGYALAGTTRSFGAGNTDAWLVKTDAFGNHLWNRTYGGTGSDFALDLVQTTDGGYALAGLTYSFGAGNGDVWLVKTDSFGSHLWNRTYGGVGEDRAWALVETVDGGYALACSTSSLGAGNSDFWLVKTSSDGNHLWNKTYGGTSYDDPLTLVQTIDGGYALAGRTGSFGAGSSDVWLVKTDAFGSHSWDRTSGGADEDYAGSMVQMSDEGYTLAGATKSFGAGNDDFWLVKALREVSTITVPDDYPKVQEAINNAIDGDTIFVRAGTYYEHVVVNKTLSLTGENSTTTIIDGNKTGTVVLVTADGVELTGFTIQAGQNTHPICNVWLENVTQCTIHGNMLKTAFYGVYLNEANGNSVYENFATDGSIGICGVRSNGNLIHRNTFAANSFAGINLHLCSFNNFTENLLNDNSVGTRLLDGANNNNIYHNSFVNNTVQTYIQFSYNNTWDDGYPSGGNYWSNYAGFDARSGLYQNETGSDGIGDTPYLIGSNNRDNYPLMKPWTPQALTTDINNDGKVNILDITIVAKAFDTKQGDPAWNEAADLDKNGQVNIIDISMVAKDYGKT